MTEKIYRYEVKDRIDIKCGKCNAPVPLNCSKLFRVTGDTEAIRQKAANSIAFSCWKPQGFHDEVVVGMQLHDDPEGRIYYYNVEFILQSRTGSIELKDMDMPVGVIKKKKDKQ